MNKQFYKVNYSEYEGKYDESIKERLEKDPGSVDVEMMRAIIQKRLTLSL